MTQDLLLKFKMFCIFLFVLPAAVFFSCKVVMCLYGWLTIDRWLKKSPVILMEFSPQEAASCLNSHSRATKINRDRSYLFATVFRFKRLFFFPF